MRQKPLADGQTDAAGTAGDDGHRQVGWGCAHENVSEK
jgi:hypothetical protein